MTTLENKQTHILVFAIVKKMEQQNRFVTNIFDEKFWFGQWGNGQWINLVPSSGTSKTWLQYELTITTLGQVSTCIKTVCIFQYSFQCWVPVQRAHLDSQMTKIQADMLICITDKCFSTFIQCLLRCSHLWDSF